MSKFRLDGLYSGNYVTYISMEKNSKNSEYEIECSSNLVEL